jgi:glycerol dehydrogenase-like iron-containing ADH family enzyme
MFINIIKSLSFGTGGILKDNLIEGIFIGSGINFETQKNWLPVCDEGTKDIIKKDNLYIIKNNDLEEARKLGDFAQNYEGILAIGSGGVSDVCKYASFSAKKPYHVYATALSMNGYLSSNSSLKENNWKKSFKSHLPQKIYIDLEIVKNAPLRLTLAGFGDSMARASAQADCFLSHKKHGTPYLEELFEIRMSSEEYLLENYSLISKKDDEFFLHLAENILLSGVAMHLYGNSFPASGGEHIMAHYAESRYPLKLNKFFHGEQISAFTIEMMKIQSTYKEYPSFSSKHNLEKIFTEIGLPSSFKDLNLSADEFMDIKENSYKTRDRYTFLNLPT